MRKYRTYCQYYQLGSAWNLHSSARLIQKMFRDSGDILVHITVSTGITPCNKVREVARRRTVMFDDGGMNDETSATVQ